jgi:hypothetical protein
MSWEDDGINYYGNDGMVGDSSRRRSKTSKSKVPRFKPIVKKKIPSTDFGQAMGGLTMGMLLIFPAIALLTVAAPKVIFSIIGLIALITWLTTQNGKFALIILGVCLAPVVLGFVSLGLFMLILG